MDFSSGDLHFGKSGTVIVSNDLTVSNALYIGDTALTNDNWNPDMGWFSSRFRFFFTGGSVADATTFSSGVTLSDTLAVSRAAAFSNALTVVGTLTVEDAYGK